MHLNTNPRHVTQYAWIFGRLLCLAQTVLCCVIWMVWDHRVMLNGRHPTATRINGLVGCLIWFDASVRYECCDSCFWFVTLLFKTSVYYPSTLACMILSSFFLTFTPSSFIFVINYLCILVTSVPWARWGRGAKWPPSVHFLRYLQKYYMYCYQAFWTSLGINVTHCDQNCSRGSGICRPKMTSEWRHVLSFSKKGSAVMPTVFKLERHAINETVEWTALQNYYLGSLNILNLKSQNSKIIFLR